MTPFVKSDSIVRTIWSDTDCILFIFGACAGEFAHSKAIDWLFYTGKLPNDPIGRLFSTVTYARQIIFDANAQATIVTMTQIHRKIEEKRGYNIPEWVYQDVLFMLIGYSVKVYELLHKPLSLTEKSEVYDIFRRIGEEMEIKNLPEDWHLWESVRELHLSQNYAETDLTKELFSRYKKSLGSFRFSLLLAVQSFLLPPKFQKSRQNKVLRWLFNCYNISKAYWPIREVKFYLLPKSYQQTLRSLSTIKTKKGCPFSKLIKHSVSNARDSEQPRLNPAT